ncbi:hypothetical protein QUB47_02470 [Microcoleus sp. AT9_B5]
MLKEEGRRPFGFAQGKKKEEGRRPFGFAQGEKKEEGRRKKEDFSRSPLS